MTRKQGAKLTLHEAMLQVLIKAGCPLSAKEIIAAIERTGLYQKRDGSRLLPSQIYARVSQYPDRFKGEGTPRHFSPL